MDSRWVLGIIVTVMGMGTVFLVLGLLAAGIGLLNRIYDFFASNAVAAEEKNNVKTPPAEQAGETIAHSKDQVSDHILVLITAAIASALGQPVANFKLTTIRRLEEGRPSAVAWPQSGRLEIIANRQSFNVQRRKAQ